MNGVTSWRWSWCFLVLLGSLDGCSPVKPNHKTEVIGKETVAASFYGQNDLFTGKKTASGELFDPDVLTAGHRSYPFGTRLEVTNPKNGRKVVVRVNDRGPYKKGRLLDLSPEAAERLGVGPKGKSMLQVRVVSKPSPIEKGEKGTKNGTS